MHADCKINFNLESSFGTGYNPSDYFCELDFDLDYESGEEYKCNPNTVTFPRGHDYTLHFRIVHTPEVSLSTERTILVHSPSLSGSSSSTGTIAPPVNPPAPTIVYGGGTTSSVPLVLTTSISIQNPIIIVQS